MKIFFISPLLGPFCHKIFEVRVAHRNRNVDSGGDGGNDNMPPQSSGHDDRNNGDDNGHNGHNGHNGGGREEDSGNSNEVKLYIGNLDYGAFDY